MKDPHLIKVKKGSTYRAMIKGKSPLPPHNTVVTFVSTSDSRVASHFKWWQKKKRNKTMNKKKAGGVSHQNKIHFFLLSVDFGIISMEAF